MMGVSAQATSAAALLVVLAAAFCASPSNAFVILPAADRLAADQSSSSTISIARPSAFSHASSLSISSSSTVLYMAAEGKKKRRRKRKDGKTPSSGSDESPSVPIVDDDDDGELPGFDLGDDEQVEEFKMEPTKAEAPANAASASVEASEVAMASDPSDASVDMSNPKVMEAMKGSMPGVASAGSTEDLLRNRDLEKSFKFDDTNVKEDLPSLGQLAGKKGMGGGGGSTEPSSPGSVEQKVGSKRARAEARRAAAIEAERAAEEEKSFLQKVPQFLDEKGEVSPIKILESGTWVGIGILVLWEVYINSPFFERAAPMAPVVYELLF